jgi:hypothetical protein
MLGFHVMAEQTHVLINYISSFKKKNNKAIAVDSFCWVDLFGLSLSFWTSLWPFDWN